jgi:hypothetical protein
MGSSLLSYFIKNEKSGHYLLGYNGNYGESQRAKFFSKKIFVENLSEYFPMIYGW